MSHSTYADSVKAYKEKLQAAHRLPDLIYNVICQNHGQHPKCLGRFTSHKKGGKPDFCPNCIHINRQKV